MSRSQGGDARQASSALAEAATAAGYAPSVHNTQPWRWRVAGNELTLYGEQARQLAASDPAGRLLIVSAGAALHHARVSLAAQGWEVVVNRIADPTDAVLLAQVTLIGRGDPSPEAIRLVEPMQVRHTDRRTV